MQADLLFKKLTGFTKNKLLPPKPVPAGFTSSFSPDDPKDIKKEQLNGLNRMDFDTFVLALSDIANQLYSQYYHNGINELQTRGEA